MSRIEIYLDDDPDPLHTITGPPGEFEIDTSHLPRGAHTLRLRGTSPSGVVERDLHFVVSNGPELSVVGLEDGDRVRGPLRGEVAWVDDENPQSTGRSWPSFLAALLILGAVWIYVVTSGTLPLRTVRSPVATTPQKAVGPAPPGASAGLGKQLYDAHCSPCHSPTGAGMDGTVPPLAGNPDVADVGRVVGAVLNGQHGRLAVEGRQFNAVMPAVGAQFSAEDLAALATYVRTNLGNHFGAVGVADVKPFMKKASQ